MKLGHGNMKYLLSFLNEVKDEFTTAQVKEYCKRKGIELPSVHLYIYLRRLEKAGLVVRVGRIGLKNMRVWRKVSKEQNKKAEELMVKIIRRE